jgi:hypothetical protein
MLIILEERRESLAVARYPNAYVACSNIRFGDSDTYDLSVNCHYRFRFLVHDVQKHYVEGGRVIQNNVKTLSGKPFDSISDDFCTNGASGDAEYATTIGGDRAFTASFKRGAVLVMSICTDGSMG